MDRRTAIKGLLGCTALAEASCNCTEAPKLTFEPAIFDVTPTSAIVWARTNRPAALEVDVATDPTFGAIAQTIRFSSRTETDFTAKVSIENLRPGATYYARLRHERQPLAKPLSIKTIVSSATRVTIAWGADLYEKHSPFTLLKTLENMRPDAWLLLGDTTYADWGPAPAHNLEGFREKHRIVRKDPHLQALLRTIPTYAVWDDHEVRNNFDRAHPLYPAGRQSFEEYWPGGRTGDGMYRSLEWGNLVHVLLLDTRSFRRSAADKTLLGETQMQWLLAELKASRASFKLIASTVPVLAPFGDDTWHGFPRDKHRLLHFIRQEKIPGVIVASADLHLAWDLSDDRAWLTEVIAGPCGAPCFSELLPRRIPIVENSRAWFQHSALNFGLVTFEATSDSATASIQIVTENGARHTVRRLTAGLP